MQTLTTHVEPISGSGLVNQSPAIRAFRRQAGLGIGSTSSVQSTIDNDQAALVRNVSRAISFSVLPYCAVPDHLIPSTLRKLRGHVLIGLPIGLKNGKPFYWSTA